MFLFGLSLFCSRALPSLSDREYGFLLLIFGQAFLFGLGWKLDTSSSDHPAQFLGLEHARSFFSP